MIVRKLKSSPGKRDRYIAAVTAKQQSQVIIINVYNVIIDTYSDQITLYPK